MNNKQIGDRLRYYRHKKGLTQQDLADKIGVTWEMISRYERGQSSAFTKVELLSDALSVSPTEFISAGYSDNNSINSSTNVIPYINSNLFSKINNQASFNRLISETFSYYNSPSWINVKFPESFAIEAGAVKSNTISTTEKGVWYFSKVDITDIKTELRERVVLYLSKSGILVDVFNKDIGTENILGILIAQEERFV
jgi:transcriptional regulator with XRE-family HTH domain